MLKDMKNNPRWKYEPPLLERLKTVFKHGRKHGLRYSLYFMQAILMMAMIWATVVLILALGGQQFQR